MKNGLIVDKNGNKRYYLNGELHRVDGPAQEYANGAKFWYLNGELHRVDGPAVEWSDGGKVWYLHDEMHREDGPAQEFANGIIFWWLHGEQLYQPEEFKTMETWFNKLGTDEEYSLRYINDINGLIGFIKNPTPKQKRLNAMKWKI